VQKDNQLGDEFTFKPSEITEVCENHGIEIPGCRINMGRQTNTYAGRESTEAYFRKRPGDG